MKRPNYPQNIRNILYKQHKTADEVFGVLQTLYPQVGKATVYRHLESMTHAGVISRVMEQNGNTFYEYNEDPHIHFFDTQTNEIMDLPMDWVRTQFPEGFCISDIIVKGVRTKPL